MINFFSMCLFIAYTPITVAGIYIICVAPWWLEQYTNLYRGFALSYVIGSALAILNIALLFFRDPDLLMIENRMGLIIFAFLIALNFIIYLKLFGFSRAAFSNVEWDDEKNYPKFD